MLSLSRQEVQWASGERLWTRDCGRSGIACADDSLRNALPATAECNLLETALRTLQIAPDWRLKELFRRNRTLFAAWALGAHSRFIRLGGNRAFLEATHACGLAWQPGHGVVGRNPFGNQRLHRRVPELREQGDERPGCGRRRPGKLPRQRLCRALLHVPGKQGGVGPRPPLYRQGGSGGGRRDPPRANDDGGDPRLGRRRHIPDD